jgi:hypothetical protein
MPEAVAVSVAKSVTAFIAERAAEATYFCQTFQPERSYADWEMQLDDEDLHVDIALVTTEQKTDLGTRGSLVYDVPLDIAIRKHLGADKQNDDTGRIAVDQVDGLMLLVQELEELFTERRLTDPLATIWQSTRILAAPIIKHLREMRQFTAIIRVDFRTDKNIA